MRGTAPTLGKVTRMERRTRQRTGSRRGGVMRGGDAREVIFIRCGLFLLLVLMLAGGFLVFSSEKDPSGPIQGREEMERKKEPNEPPLGEERALALVQAAIGTKDADRALARFHLGAGGAGELRASLQRILRTEGEPQSYEWLGEREVNRVRMETVSVKFSREGKVSERLAMITADGRGLWKIDHDAFVRKVEPSWKEILGGRTDPSIVRVALAPARVFGGPFADDGSWDCYVMSSPDCGEALLGYCKVGTRRALVLKAMAARGGSTDFRAVLQVERVDPGQGERFEILRVLAEDWVLGERAIDLLPK